MAQSNHSKPLVVMRPSRAFSSLDLVDLWRYRDLIFIFCWRDLKVRYKQTVLGVTWAVLIPFTTMIVFSLLFGTLAKMPSDGFPYPIFVYAGLLPWQMFSKAFLEVGNCLVSNQGLIKKIYFPRLVLPTASVLPGIVDFCLGLLVLAAMMVFYGVTPTWGLVLFPFYVIYANVVAIAVGLWLATLNVTYRDIRYLLPFIGQFWFFATPVVYPTSIIGEPWNTLFNFNPMTSVIDGFRWTLLGGPPPSITGTLISMAVTALFLIGGAYYFKSFERVFADRL